MLGMATNSHSSATKNMYFVGILCKTDTCQLCSHQLDMGYHHFGVRSISLSMSGMSGFSEPQCNKTSGQIETNVYNLQKISVF